MCEIKEVTTPKEHRIFICTPYDGDFMSAKAVNLFDAMGGSVRITKFCVGQTTNCFNRNPIAPVVKIDEDVDDRFLQKGNKIEFEIVIKDSKPTTTPVSVKREPLQRIPTKRKPARVAAMEAVPA